jgi:hypothetical protein
MTQNFATDFDRASEPLEPNRTFQRLVPDEGLIDRVPDDMGREPPHVADATTGDIAANPRGMDSVFNIEVDFHGL